MVDEYKEALLSTISTTLKLKCVSNESTNDSILSYLLDSNFIEYFEDNCPLVSHLENSLLFNFYFIIILLLKRNLILSSNLPITLSLD
jgi:hypothetical protein